MYDPLRYSTNMTNSNTLNRAGATVKCYYPHSSGYWLCTLLYITNTLGKTVCEKKSWIDLELQIATSWELHLATAAGAVMTIEETGDVL